MMLLKKEEIQAWLKEMKINKYRLNHNLTVDVPISVDLSCKNLTEIPIQFGIVEGSFSIDQNQLTSLKGCPRKVDESFFANDNLLVNLDFFPKKIGGTINLNDNSLTSLKGMPSVANEDIGIAKNSLKSLSGIPLIIKGTLNCSYNQLEEDCYKILNIDNDLIITHDEKLQELEDFYTDEDHQYHLNINFNQYKEIMSKRELRNKLNKELIENANQNKNKL